MGTRSLTRIFETYKDEKKNKQVKHQLVNMYRQYDGYPSGHGLELVEFLNSGKVVNGIGMGDVKVFNGASCLAAQMIAYFKNEAGGFYIKSINAKNCGQEYEYHILVDFDTKEITLKCYENGYMNKKGDYVGKNRLLFSGFPTDFEQFVEKYNENS
jgi:hypothetical protein